MRKLMTTILAAMVTISPMATAAEVHTPSIIPLAHITEQQAQAFFEGQEEPVVIEIEQGLTIPLSLFVTGDLLQLDADYDSGLAVQVVDTVYLKYESSGFRFSSNMVDWYPLEAFVTGELNASLDVNEGVPQFRLGAELYIKHQ